MKKKLKIILPLVLVIGLAGAYKVVMAKPKPILKVQGTVYVLGKDFLLNLADGRFAKLDVALVLPPTALPKSGGEGGSTPPDGYGALPEEAAVRDIVTNTVTDASSSDLLDATKREQLKHVILHQIDTQTDVDASQVLFTDVTVQ